ncbi:TIGR04104 family putative zinc finger protein [Planococcus koreensis]|uniref:TIGR04104 family putative zinc finger protein n=1 Tax=Planococcus koreensis TaxID=112331 RepID=UPI0039FC0794
MPTCQNCKNRWGWAQTIRKMPFLDTGMICPYCSTKQYPTNPSKKKWGLAGLLTPSVMLVAWLFELPPLFSLGILVLTFSRYWLFIRFSWNFQTKKNTYGN